MKPIPIGIIDMERGEVVKVKELVARYFSEGKLLSPEDERRVRGMAFQIYLERMRMGVSGSAKADWEQAKGKVAIQKYCETCEEEQSEGSQ